MPEYYPKPRRLAVLLAAPNTGKGRPRTTYHELFESILKRPGHELKRAFLKALIRVNEARNVCLS